jgi:ethanolamine utilization protein EutN
MNLALVIGHATATIKHPTLKGWKLIVVQPLDARGKPDGEPQLALDRLGAIRRGTVMITSDGGAVREMVGSKNTPARWAVIGLADE